MSAEFAVREDWFLRRHTMRYEDRIYGPVTIEEPVLIALMQSAAMQRLHGVLQHGISGLIGLTAPVSRFEHSMGVMLLVRRLGAPLDEQIAALLHDVSHTAFSHVIDYVFGGHDDQSYHEREKEHFVETSDLPDVLGRYGYDWRAFLHEEAYPLLEQPAPALCADRLDYFLRDSHDLKLGTDAQIRSALDHLVVQDGRIMIDNLDSARWFAYTYIAADDASWANFREVGLYEVTARAIRLGLDRGVLSHADLWGVDQVMWDKLRATDDPAVQAELGNVSLDTRFVWDELAPDFWVSTKLRTIDPDVVLNGSGKPLSALDPAFARHREGYLRSKTGKWPVRIIPA
jgi:HD superfamily phosphohydrolase